jgi:hypothetical protein
MQSIWKLENILLLRNRHIFHESVMVMFTIHSPVFFLNQWFLTVLWISHVIEIHFIGEVMKIGF